MAGIFSYQPFKGLYLTYTFVIVLFKVPFWILGSFPRSQRPRYSWDLKRVVLVRLLQRITDLNRTVDLFNSPTHLALGPPGLDFDGVWVDGVPQLVTGQLESWAEIASVSSVRIPGYWLRKKNTTIPVAAPPMPGEKVIYSIHGGAFVRFSAHPADPTADITRDLLKYCDTVHRVFSIEYRLSAGLPKTPANPFPAALLDALAGYSYLVNEVGFSPEDIIVEGDSAGGNIAHALTRYLVEYQNAPGVHLPAPPGALLLISPFVDAGQSHEGPNGSMSKFVGIDYLQGSQGTVYIRAAYLGPHGTGAGEHNQYISPASVHPSMKISFNGFPRTFIIAGGAELLLDQIKTFRDRMVNDLGEGNGVKEGEGKVRYFEAKDGIHDYLVFRWYEPERGETFKAIAEWLHAA